MKHHAMFVAKVALAMCIVNALFDLLKSYGGVDLGNYYDYPVSSITGKGQ